MPGASKAFSTVPGKAFDFKTATLRIDGKDLESAPIKDDETHITFTAKLEESLRQLAPVFKDANGKKVGAYYLIVSPAE